jgi:hypothetical protein
MDIKLIHETPDRSMTLASRGSLFITIHRRDYTAEEVAVLHRIQLAFAHEVRAPLALLTILDVTERHIVRFGGAARDATLELARDIGPHVRCSAVLFDRDGFAGSAIRSLVTTVNFLSKQSFPTRVFGEMGAALTWLESNGKDSLDFDRAALEATIRALRAPRAA